MNNLYIITNSIPETCEICFSYNAHTESYPLTTFLDKHNEITPQILFFFIKQRIQSLETKFFRPDLISALVWGKKILSSFFKNLVFYDEIGSSCYIIIQLGVLSRV